MKLKKFLEKLEDIKEKYGDKIEVVMADNIPVVEPIFSAEYPNGKNVIITDKKLWHKPVILNKRGSNMSGQWYYTTYSSTRILDEYIKLFYKI